MEKDRRFLCPDDFSGLIVVAMQDVRNPRRQRKSDCRECNTTAPRVQCRGSPHRHVLQADSPRQSFSFECFACARQAFYGCFS